MTEEVRVATIVEARGAVNAVSVIDRGIAVVESRSVIDVLTMGGGGASTPAGISFSQSDVLLGRSVSGAGAGQEIPCNSFGRSVLDAALTAGSLLFASGSPAALAEDNASLFWNAATRQLGVGTNVIPNDVAMGGIEAPIVFVQAPTDYSFSNVQVYTPGLNAIARVRMRTDATSLNIDAFGSNFYGITSLAGRAGFSTGANDMIIYTDASSVSGGTHGVNISPGGYSNVTISFRPGVLRMSNAVSLEWSSGDPSSVVGDVKLVRDAANVLALRNGTIAQTLRVYHDYTDAANYERIAIGWTLTQGNINVEVAGTGTSGGLGFQTNGGNLMLGGGYPSNKQITVNGALGFMVTSTQRGVVGPASWDSSTMAFQNATITESAANCAISQGTTGATVVNAASGQILYFRIGNGNGWSLQTTSAHLYANTDSSQDIGQAASNRPRNVYVGRNLYLAGGLGLKVKAGAITDTDFTGPVDGFVAADSTNSKLWVRLGGVWKSAALT